MKKMTKMLTSLVVICAIVCSFSVFAVQTSISFNQSSQKGSITIDYSHEGDALAGVDFEVYRVTDYTSGAHKLISDFREVEVDFTELTSNKYWRAFADTLANFIYNNKVKPDDTFTTDKRGKYTLDNLPAGIYFIQADMTTQGNLQIFAEPIVIAVGQYDSDEDEYVYDFTVDPKVWVKEEDDPQDITVRKVWENVSLAQPLPAQVEVVLYRDGVPYDTVILSTQNGWTYTWKDIDPDSAWSVYETTVIPQFVPSYIREMFFFTVKNTYIPIVPPEFPEIPDQPTPPEPTDPEIPQTGSYAPLIPALSSLGVIFLLLGVLLKYPLWYKKDDES